MAVGEILQSLGWVGGAGGFTLATLVIILYLLNQYKKNRQDEHGEVRDDLLQFIDKLQANMDKQSVQLLDYGNQLKEANARYVALVADLAQAQAELASVRKELVRTQAELGQCQARLAKFQVVGE